MSAPTMPSLTTQTLNAGLGSRFIGSVLNLMLQAFVVVQVFRYFSQFGGKRANHDPVWLQLVVASVLLFSVLQCIFLFYMIYDIHVVNFTDPLWVFKFHWALLAAHVCTVCIEVITQAYFIRRCYMLLRKSKIFLFGMALLVLFALADGCAFTVVFLSMNTLSLQTHAKVFQGLIGSWLAASVTIDFLITGVMVVELRRLRTESKDFVTTATGLDRMILYALNTCAICTVLAGASFIIYFSTSNAETWYFITYEPISKAYALSFMANLLSRKSLGNAMRSPASSDQLGFSFRRTQQSIYPSLTPDGLPRDHSLSASAEKHAFPMSDYSSSEQLPPFEQNLGPANDPQVFSDIKVVRQISTSH